MWMEQTGNIAEAAGRYWGNAIFVRFAPREMPNVDRVSGGSVNRMATVNLVNFVGFRTRHFGSAGGR